MKLYTISSQCSKSIFVAKSEEDAKMKYLKMLQMSENELRMHPGYMPGCFTNGTEILGRGSCGPWKSFMLHFDKNNLELLFNEGYLDIRCQDLDDAVVMVDFFDD